MDEVIQTQHTFSNHLECKESEEKKAQDEIPKTATICVGSTGTGKSSLINLFSSQQVNVGHGTKSETPGSSLVPGGETGYWLDSQGANCSSGVADEKVLTDILKQLYNKNVNKIKVVWFVSGDMCREKQEFQAQAKFIQSLGNGVWSSCLLIVKKGEPQPKDMDGVLAAARHYGANINKHDSKHLFGYTGLEFGDLSNDRLLKMINKIEDDTIRKQGLLECGYLTNTEIVAYVGGKLSKLSSLSIHFENKKCSKCGAKGDPRFIYAPCHTEKEKYHPKSTVPYHSGSLRNFHTQNVINYHKGRPQPKNSYESYHPGSWTHTESYTWYHSGSWHKYSANYIWNNYADGKWTCCRSTSSSDAGCKRSTSYSSSYSCCGSTSSSGCSSKVTNSWVEYSCCGGNEDSIGCEEKYSCCNESRYSNGCRKEWDCCNASQYNQGCQRKHECCDQDMKADGCKDRCQACKKTWGIGVGCIQTLKKQL